jgi:hypothetical protein
MGSEIDLYLRSGQVVIVPEADVPQAIKANGIGTSPIMDVHVKEEEWGAAQEAMKKAIGLAKTIQHSGTAYLGLQNISRAYGGSEKSLEKAYFALGPDDKRLFGQLIDMVCDSYEWEGWFPKFDNQPFRYSKDWVVKRPSEGGYQLDFTLPKYQRLLSAWEYALTAMLKLLGESAKFTVGFTLDVNDWAEMSEWGERKFFLLDPRKFKGGDRLALIVGKLWARAAWCVAHADVTKLRFLMKEGAPLIAEWIGDRGQKSPIGYVNSRGAWKKGNGK